MTASGRKQPCLHSATSSEPLLRKCAHAAGMNLYEITTYRHQGTSPSPHHLFCDTTF